MKKNHGLINHGWPQLSSWPLRLQVFLRSAAFLLLPLPEAWASRGRIFDILGFEVWILPRSEKVIKD